MLGLTTLLAIALQGAEAPRGVDLAKLQGWDIVVVRDAPPSVAYAAAELQAHLERATGVRLPIVDAAGGRPDRHISIGSSAEFGPEDFRIVIGDDRISIAGGPPRGTLYGVYTFLEDYLGVRFLTADHTHIPPVATWRVVGPVDRFFHPHFAMRWTYYGEINRDQAFAARMRVNTVTHDPKFGGVTGITNISHSFVGQIPSARYGKDHPEYYCLIDGKRLASVGSDAYDNEPCLTNPDVLRIVTDAVLAELAANPNRENVSVSQNDNDKYCRCDACAAIDAREGTPMGSLLTFVNAVADEVAKKYPSIKVGTLSYWYTRKPPATIKPRPNVQIQLCSIECCLLHPINDPACPQNVVFCRDIEGWGKICDYVSIWNYNTNFTNYLLPCPNLRVIEPNVRFFAANKAKAIFMQAAGDAFAAELSDLRTYLISNLIWDPSRSGEALIDEFCRLHYGAAAPAIRRYVDLVHETALGRGVHRNCFAGRAAEYGLDDATATKALALFDEAFRLAGGDEAIKGRLEKAAVAAYRLAIEPVWQANDEMQKDAKLAERLRPIVERFLELCERSRVDRGSEGAPFSAARDRLQQLLGAWKAGEKRS